MTTSAAQYSDMQLPALSDERILMVDDEPETVTLIETLRLAARFRAS